MTFRTTCRAFSCALVAALCLAAVYGGKLHAQEAGALSIEPWGGVALPAGPLADVASLGGAFGIGTSYAIVRAVGWRADLGVLLFDDQHDPLGAVPSPPLRLIHFTTGPEVDLPRQSDQSVPVSFRFNVGVGGTSMRATHVYEDESSVDFRQTYPTVSSGGVIAYEVSRRLGVAVRAQAHLVFADREDTEVFAERSAQVETFRTFWSVPVSVGLTIRP